MRSKKRALRGGGLGYAAALAALWTLVVLLSGEVVLRVVYAVAGAKVDRVPMLYETVYMNVPPWTRSASIMRRDPDLELWTRSNVARSYVNLFGPIPSAAQVDALLGGFFPPLPAWAVHRPVWTVRTNSLGLRGPEPAVPKPEGTFRVVAMGDSWTFGVNVEEDDAFPRRLEALLRAAHPGRAVEVVDYGRIAAAARTGRALMKSRIPALKPDLLVVGYAQNDEYRFHVANAGPASLSACGPSELCRLAAYLAGPPAGISTTLPGVLDNPWLGAENDPPEPCAAADLEASPYYRDMDAIAAEAGRLGVPVVLLYANMPDGKHCTREALRRLAARRELPLVDAAELLRARAAREEAALERSLGLGSCRVGAPRDGLAEVVLRVHAPGRGAVSVVGDRPELGGRVPNQVALGDDGTRGDQKAGDGVFSRSFRLPPGASFSYLFTSGGAPGRWEGLENYWPRRFRVPPRGGCLPVQEFGSQPLRSDPFHTTAVGHSLIAEALASEILRRTPSRAWPDAR